MADRGWLSLLQFLRTRNAGDWAERRRATSRQDALLRIARLAAEVDADQLLTDLLHEMVALVGGDAGGVYIWDEEKGGLVTVRNSLPYPFPLIRPGEGGAGRVWIAQRPLIIDNYQAESNVIGAAARAGIRTAVVVPLNHAGHRIGALGISSFDPHKRFNQADVEVLEVLAATAAATLASLERTRLLQDTVGQLSVAIERAHAEIRERERAEAALRDSEARFRLLAENARDVLFRYRIYPTRGFDYISQAAVDLTGYSLAELYRGPGPGRNYLLVHPEDSGVLQQIIEAQVVPKDFLLIRWIHKSGAIIWTEQRHAPVYDDDGRLIAVEVVARDITERLRTEAERERRIHEQAARAQAEAEVRHRDEFLSIAAHDLKTPITSLHATAQFLLRRLTRGDAIDRSYLQERLITIVRQSSKLARLVEQLFDLARITSGQFVIRPEPTDLTHLTAELIAGYQADRNHQLSLDAPEAVVVPLDPLRIEQVLTNLIDNACKYSPAGSPVEISIRWRPEGVARVAVRDHGIGIPPEHRPDIFDRFRQAHPSSPAAGIGLGLYISRQIVELHGGTIGAEFPDSGGSRFVIDLPAKSG